MTSRTFLLASTMALAGALTVGPAQADERRCVSQQEYRDVDDGEFDSYPGWRKARVDDHFDITGTRIALEKGRGGGLDTVWKYRKCSTWGPGGWYVGIHYDNYTWYGDTYMRVVEKTPNRPFSLTEGL